MLTYFFKNFILNLYGLCDLSFRNIGFGVCARFPLGKTSAVLIVPWPMSRHFVAVLRHGLRAAPYCQRWQYGKPRSYDAPQLMGKAS